MDSTPFHSFPSDLIHSGHSSLEMCRSCTSSPPRFFVKYTSSTSVHWGAAFKKKRWVDTRNSAVQAGDIMIMMTARFARRMMAIIATGSDLFKTSFFNFVFTG